MTALSRVGYVCGLNEGGEDRSVKVVGKGMCSRQGARTAANEAHSSGGGSQGACGKKAVVSPAKATRKWPLVESVTSPAMGS